MRPKTKNEEIETYDDHETYAQTRRVCSQTPKGFYLEAQGKRSATLGRDAVKSPTLKGLYRHASYLGGTCRKLKSPSLTVGEVEDHVHILCRFGRTITTADLLLGLKKESSKWIKRKDRSLDNNAEYDERYVWD